MTNEDIQRALEYINNHISFKEARNIGVCKEEITIRQCLTQALQPDYKAIAEDMAKALKCASAYISQNNPHWSASYHNETTRNIIEALAKWEEIKDE